MLNKCNEISSSIYLQFDVKKCHCMVTGKMYKVKIAPMLLDGHTERAVECCDCIKYFGVYLANAKSVKFDINTIKRSFYAASHS